MMYNEFIERVGMEVSSSEFEISIICICLQMLIKIHFVSCGQK